MEIKIKINEKVYINKISEKNSKFKCENCGKEIYGKKVTENDTYERFCLNCLFKYYNRTLKNFQGKIKENKKELKKIKEKGKRIKKEEDGIIKVRNKVKEKYSVDLVALEL